MNNLLKQNYHNHKETIHNFIWRSLQIFGKQGITFLIFVLCAKLLIPYDFGVYNYMLAIIFFLIMFGDFGISTATSKYVAEYNITDKNKLKAVLFNSGLLIFALTFVITILTIVIGPGYLKDKYVYVLYLLPTVFLAPMTSLYDGVYRGLGKFKQLAVISLIIGFILIPLIYFLIKSYGLIGALVSQNIFYLLLLIGLSFGYKDISFKINKSVIKEIASYSFIVGLASLGYFLFTRINIIILGNFGYLVEVGYYELINKFIMFALIPFSIFSQVISPRITSLYIENKSAVFNSYKKNILNVFFISIIIAVVLGIIFPKILELFLIKYNVSDVVTGMNLLLILFVFECMMTIASLGFNIATGHANLNMKILILFGFLNLPISYYMVYRFGFIGIIYSTLLLKSMADILFIFIYYRKLKVNSKYLKL